MGIPSYTSWSARFDQFLDETYRYWFRERQVTIRAIETPRYGNVYATYVSLDFDPNLPPPAATTTYCLPPTANVLGVA